MIVISSGRLEVRVVVVVVVVVVMMMMMMMPNFFKDTVCVSTLFHCCFICS